MTIIRSPRGNQISCKGWALGASREKIVILRGDRKVLLGQAVSVLDAAQQAGASGIALATRPPAPGEK